MSDFRFETLTAWLKTELVGSFKVELISGDASFRRYFRVFHGSHTFIAVDSPIELVAIIPFIELTKSYDAQHLAVPQVIAQESAQGFMLLSDLGDTQLGSVLSDASIKHYYSESLTLLNSVARVESTPDHKLPVFDEKFIKTELSIFDEWFIGRHLQLNLDNGEIELLHHVYNILSSALLEQPQCTMHRDFHSRNIMVKNQKLYLIDYQDSVIGPFTYDAVSLLRDCYVGCPKVHFETLQQQHFEQSLEAGILSKSVSFTQYQRWFDLTGLQRHIKVAGIFSRLFYRDNKIGYLKDIPQTLNYIIEVTSKYPELAEFDLWMKSKIIPLFQQVSKGNS
ncbi:aminoglycoside phosphotransferase [Shewanella sp. OPT22]|nr:aminoglycoside phosphotransferase [Shewanella sp. OPT22]